MMWEKCHNVSKFISLTPFPFGLNGVSHFPVVVPNAYMLFHDTVHKTSLAIDITNRRAKKRGEIAPPGLVTRMHA